MELFFTEKYFMELFFTGKYFMELFFPIKYFIELFFPRIFLWNCSLLDFFMEYISMGDRLAPTRLEQSF